MKNINKTWKDNLQEILKCDLKSLYPLARSLNRKLYFYVGPTNSGKTYQAINELKNSTCGIYLAPLRLLALEVYEDLKNNNIQASLITGEEQIFNEEAAHICSTIEMIDFDLDTDICVIDEVQMLDDPQRGWAWINSIIGVPSKKVIMTGSVNTLDALKKIALYLQEDLQIVKFKRKTPLKLLENHIPLRNIKKGTALIAFSRNDVLKYKSKLEKYHKISVIYGNLSPEVRKEEARKFRKQESDILIATDAISMGLNLPIETILFTTHIKFDGINKRELSSNEIIQIAGRAGRFGYHKKGLIGAISNKTFTHIKKMFDQSIKTIKAPFKVKASSKQIEELSTYLQTKNLTKILNFFANNMVFNGPFIPVSLASMLSAARLIEDKSNLKLEDKYMLSQAPISIKSILIKKAFLLYVNSILNNRIVSYKTSIKSIQNKKLTSKDLLQIEDEIKKISLYLWLSYKLPEIFIDKIKAEKKRNFLNKLIQKSLKENIPIETSKKHRFKDNKIKY
jgi:ATP-dependent RNA helicase SUPV3L1/SUV3